MMMVMLAVACRVVRRLVMPVGVVMVQASSRKLVAVLVMRPAGGKQGPGGARLEWGKDLGARGKVRGVRMGHVLNWKDNYRALKPVLPMRRYRQRTYPTAEYFAK